VKKLEAIIKFPLDRLSIPIDTIENSALRSLRHNQIIFRRDMSELLAGLEPQISQEAVLTVQKEFSIRKMVAVPLVAEGNVIGALFGFTRLYFINERMVETLESFANQAAMAIQTAQLISELRRKNLALQEANRVKSEFLATMSHELRTPLTAIIGFSELLLEGVMGELNNEQKDSVREVLNNGANLLDMINNLLDLAKADSGKMDLSVSEFDLKDLLARSSHTVSALIHRKQHRVRHEIQEGMPFLNADEKRVQQTVLNLLSNAIKFTPDGGEIKIEAKYFPSLDLAIRDGAIACPKPVAGKSAFFVSVSDTGIGIKQEHLELIFDVFSQVDSGATRSYEGTGLGLALARQFVELHGGIIWAESAYGKGAKFSFLIPQGPKKE
jgi:signal transduction histidine kinase